MKSGPGLLRLRGAAPRDLAEIGFAAGFGVLLDTVLVRTVLVPALVHDIGPGVW